MSTIHRPRPLAQPPLVAGERLDRATFHERYEAMPPDTRAELIGGGVHMPSPLSHDHGRVSYFVSTWLGHFELFTRGVAGVENASIFLDDSSEPQPDAVLLITTQCGGQTRKLNRYITGAPELVVEIALSSQPIDLGDKYQDYERTGVLEYLVVGLEPNEIHWFVRRGDRFRPLPPGSDGLYRSEVFPGLWLDSRALFSEDLNRLIATLDQGLASAEHAAFVARLAATGGTP